MEPTGVLILLSTNRENGAELPLPDTSLQLLGRLTEQLKVLMPIRGRCIEEGKGCPLLFLKIQLG